MIDAQDQACDDQLPARLADAWPIEGWKDVSVLVAVSGGPDSVALLRALVELRSTLEPPLGRLVVAHFNHRWRAEHSDGDVEFVRAMCESLELPYFVGVSSEPVRKEEAARSERYEFLRETAEAEGARYLAVAHTADDQAETILHRILRGTGLRGLRGIRPRRRLNEAVTLVRPMLDVSRAEVMTFLEANGYDYLTDSTNELPTFTRNRIRIELIPQLAQDYNPGVADAIRRLGSLAAEAGEVVDLVVDAALADCLVSQSATLVELDRERLACQREFVQRELFARIWREQMWPEQAMGNEQWCRILDAVKQRSVIELPGAIRLEASGPTIGFMKSET